MAANDLHDPLGLDRPSPREPGRDVPWVGVALSGMGVLALGLVTFSILTDNGMGGRPFAEASIERPRKDGVPPLPAPPADLPAVASSAPVAGTPGHTGASVYEMESGVRVVRQGGGEAPGALILQVPHDPLGVQLAAAPDRRLVEKGRYGNLPRIGADGARPSEVYARPVMTSADVKAGAPRLAIVVGGMGLNAAATAAAVDKLAGPVTLGFAPYGADVDRQVARAREDGHEVILQAPMEPYDKADIPGPHTLLAGLEPAQNLDHLHWLMSRMNGYVGVANFLGSKFTAVEKDFAPVMSDISGRGLLFLDDGTSPQSLAMALAAAVGASAARVDVVLDANPKPEAIEAALGRLESIARQKGSAIGYVAGQPGAVDAVARFARALEKRGVALVPLRAVAARPGASAGIVQ